MEDDGFRADGLTYEAEHDQDRLRFQFYRIKRLMSDQRWRSLSEISALTATPATSASARLRDLRKRRFGCYRVDRRPRFDRRYGVFEYRVLPPIEAIK